MSLESSNLYLDSDNVLHLPRPTLVVLCGLSGSGKSSFATRHFPETYVVSSDRCRGLVCDNVRSQEVNAEAFSLVHYIARLRLKLGRTTVIDSTALHEFARQPLLQLAQDFACPILLLIFDISEEVCRARDAARVDPPPVGAAVVAEQYRLFKEAVQAVPHEGFTRIITLTAEQLPDMRVIIEE